MESGWKYLVLRGNRKKNTFRSKAACKYLKFSDILLSSPATEMPPSRYVTSSANSQTVLPVHWVRTHTAQNCNYFVAEENYL